MGSVFRIVRWTRFRNHLTCIGAVLCGEIYLLRAKQIQRLGQQRRFMCVSRFARLKSHSEHNGKILNTDNATAGLEDSVTLDFSSYIIGLTDHTSRMKSTDCMHANSGPNAQHFSTNPGLLDARISEQYSTSTTIL